MSHDHLITCWECGMTISDIRDCNCQFLTLSHRKCGYCREQAEYGRVEAARNTGY
jgi:hypothetical protein